MTVEIFNLNSKFCWFTTSLVTKWATTKTLIPIFPHQPDFDLHHQVLLNQILLHLSSHGLKSHWACSTLHFLKLNLGLRWVQYRHGGLCVPSILWVKHQPNLANYNIICAAFKDPQSELVDPVYRYPKRYRWLHLREEYDGKPTDLPCDKSNISRLSLNISTNTSIIDHVFFWFAGCSNVGYFITLYVCWWTSRSTKQSSRFCPIIIELVYIIYMV